MFTQKTKKISVAKIAIGVLSCIALVGVYASIRTDQMLHQQEVLVGLENIETGRQQYSASLRNSHDPTKSRLLGIEIQPRSPEELIVAPRSLLRLTSVGIYDTDEMVIKSNWFALPRGVMKEEALVHCQGVSTCNYLTPHDEGIVSIIAATQGKSDVIDVTVRKPAFNIFTDTLPDWASSSIARLNSFGIAKGKDDGTYAPGEQLTYGQLLTFLYRTLLHAGLHREPEWCQDFPNVPANHYAYKPLCLFHEQKWETGWSFQPDVPVSRSQTAHYITVLLGQAFLNEIGTSQGAILADGQIYRDVPTTHTRFYDVGVVNVADIMTGNDDGSFSPDRTLNRAEAAVIVDRILRQIEILGITQL